MPLWLAGQPLVLASQSAIRRAILRGRQEFRIEIVPADIDERAIEQAVRRAIPARSAQLLAREKAHAVAARCPAAVVLGADQTLALGERRFSKPADRAAAREQLALLRGQTHELHSAIALVRDERDRCSSIARRRGSPCAHFQRRFLEAYLDAAGGGARRASGAISWRRPASSCSSASRAIISSFWDCRSCRCWSFCAGKDCCWRDSDAMIVHHVHPRPHRLARHGKIDDRALLRRGRRAGARRRRGGASAL